jgi:hypothetical protein
VGKVQKGDSGLCVHHNIINNSSSSSVKELHYVKIHGEPLLKLHVLSQTQRVSLLDCVHYNNKNKKGRESVRVTQYVKSPEMCVNA